jgi:tRNA-dihydrouridine synthase A
MDFVGRFSVAPMMDWTDRHCRAFHRTMSRHALLYTEMVTTGAIIHGDRQRLLGFDAVEHPVAVQLGGSDPAALAKCARICEDLGYDEVNLNCGCPSDRVQNGPLALWTLTEQVVAAGVDALVVHARKAWLQGLSPKENRDVPPLDYALVHQLKAERPDLPVILNGGLAMLEAGLPHLDVLDGLMLGRAAYQNPDLLVGVDPLVFGVAAPVADGFEAVEAYLPYLAGQLAQGVRLHDMTRHMLGLFTGLPGARAWRRTLATKAVERGAGLEVIAEALGHVRFGQTIRESALP